MNSIENKLSIITKAMDDKKATDIEVLDISKKTSIADYFVIATGNSSSQVTAIADEVEDKMFQAGYDKLENKEGYQSARWILMDFNDVIVHVFHKDEREFYNLERLWSQYERNSEHTED